MYNPHMKVFIDANIYLNFYTGLYTNISPLEELLNLVNEGKVELLATEQILNEVNRKKEKLSLSTISKLQKYETELKKSLPDKKKVLPRWESIRKINEKYNQDISAEIEVIRGEVNKSISPGGEVDKLLEALFEKATVYNISPSVLQQAKLRYDLGNPPKKNDNSLGDAINWELLLSNSKQEDNIVLVCNDGDFKTEKHDGSIGLMGFLEKEWQIKIGSDIRLFSKITEFLLSLPVNAKVNKEEITSAKKEEDLVSQYTSGYDIFRNTSQLFPNYSDILSGYEVKIPNPSESLKEYLESLTPLQYGDFMKSIREQLATPKKVVSEVQKELKDLLPTTVRGN